MKKIRLQKFFTDNGVMSRRATETEIEKGNITVNGAVARLGDKIDPDKDTVTYLGNVVRPAVKKKFTYIILNKPRGYITTVTDPEGRKCVMDLIADVKARVYPVGRLDRVSEGLLLLTDDGVLTNRMTHPGHDLPKLYRVKVDGHPTAEQLKTLTDPMTIDGYDLLPVEVEISSEEEDSTVLHMTLNEGRNRQIRKMCEQAGLTIRRLSRVSIGALKLNGLAVGKWRNLTQEEVDYLYRSTKR